MTKEQFHQKFLNLLLLAENEEHFSAYNLVKLHPSILFLLFYACDEMETLYFKNTHHLFHFYDVPISLCYLALKDKQIDWRL